MNLFSNAIIEALGWTLVHSLWQVTIVALVLGLFLVLLRRKSAQIRYFISYVALTGVLLWSSATFIESYRYASEKQAIREQLLQQPGYLKNLLAAQNDDVAKAQSDGAAIMNVDQIRLRAFFQRHFNLICLFWMLGMALFTFRLITGLLYARRLRSYHLVPLPEQWYNSLAELSTRLGIERKVEGFFSPLAKVPLTLGTLKPLILFPVSAFTGLSPKEIEAIIAHELAHVLRHDYLFNIFQSVVEILFFYHPAIWMISNQIRAERENSCDDIAVSATGDKLNYVKALASVQIRQTNDLHLSMAFSLKKGTVLQRIKRLQNEIAMKTNFIEGLIAAAIIVVGLTFASFASASQQSNALPEPEKGSVQKVLPDSLPPINRDSMRVVLEEKISKEQAGVVKTEELKKAVEVAMSEPDEELSAEMMSEIEEAIDGINVEKIVKEAMCVAAAAMKEASVEVENARMEIDRDEINRDMREAAREIEEARREMERDMRHDMARDGIDQATIDAAVNAASAGMDIAASVVGSLDIEGIVTSALSGVSAALEAVGNVSCDSVENESNKSENDQIKNLEKEKKQLQKKQKELEKQMKELEKRLEKLE